MDTLPSSPSIGVLGAGAWGTALAQSLACGGRAVLLQAREEDVAQSIALKRENAAFLPGVPLSPLLDVTTDPEACAVRDILLVVTPAQHVRGAVENIRTSIQNGAPVILCAKGIEIQSGLLLSTIAQEILPQAKIGLLSGPTFAREIALGLPGAATLALPDPHDARALAQVLGNKTFRLYPSDDVIGVETGGADKNVIAIAAGIVAGRGLGDTARAAIVTRGLAEIARLAVTLGGRRETVMGLSGMGDLILTATSLQSRNYSLGFALGQGRPLTDILAERHAVTEGLHTTRAVQALATAKSVDMPVCRVMHACLCEGLSLDEGMDSLLSRPVPFETI